MPRKLSEDQRLRNVLDQCAAEPVHIPGTIQSNGAILGVDVRDERVLFASSNTDEIIGMDASAILGTKLECFLPSDVRHKMMNGVVSAVPRLEINELRRIEISEKPFFVTDCFAANCTIFEFKPLPEQVKDAPNSLCNLDF